MKRASYKKDFQSWKGIMALKLLCCNIVAGRFDWKKYCTPQSYCGQEICVVPLHCSVPCLLFLLSPLGIARKNQPFGRSRKASRKGK